MSARLIVSVTASDDTADLLSFAEAVAGRGVPLSLLVRPVGPGGPLAFTSRLAGWLRERRARGDALVLHGYDHSRRPWVPSTGYAAPSSRRCPRTRRLSASPLRAG